MNQEAIIWQGKPSQLLNLKTYILFSIGCLLSLTAMAWAGAFGLLGVLFCLGKMAWAYFEVDSCSFTVTNQAVIYQYGLLTRRRSFIELYRIQDATLIEPLWMRIFGLGTIRLESLQWTSEQISFRGIKKPQQIQNMVRGLSEGRVPVADFDVLGHSIPVRALNP